MILIIDDDMQVARGLERFLRFSNLEATSVLSGSEALIMLHVRKPTLIILDLNMPTVDGMAVLRTIRKDATYDDVPILIYTSEYSQPNRLQVMDAGAQDFITKGTIGWDVLLERVRYFLGGNKAPLHLVT